MWDPDCPSGLHFMWHCHEAALGQDDSLLSCTEFLSDLLVFGA